MKYVAVSAAIALVAVAVGVLFWAATPAQQHSQAPGPAAAAKPAAAGRGPRQSARSGPVLEARGVKVIRRDASGQVQWKLTAGGKIQADPGKGEVFTADVRWRLETPDKVWQARAEQATVSEESGDVVLSGGVAISTTDGQVRIRAPAARYQMRTGRLVFDGPLTLEAGRASLKADRAVVDLKSKVLRASGVRGRWVF